MACRGQLLGYAADRCLNKSVSKLVLVSSVDDHHTLQALAEWQPRQWTGNAGVASFAQHLFLLLLISAVQGQMS